MANEIWSNRYGKNPAEGLHQWLQANIPGYKRSQLHLYLKGFAAHLGKPQKSDTVNIASDNFRKWTKFVRENIK